jgi:polyphosphate kinase 2
VIQRSQNITDKQYGFWDSIMKRKTYERELKKLQAELVALQEWAKDTGQRVVVLFEGRDAAGKGGIIKAITARVSPRVFRLVALPAPSDREKTQLYSQRYIKHMPAAGEIIIFDRSWYNRAGVESVMGFCTEEQTSSFLDTVLDFEREVVRNGIILLKYWLEVSSEEQENRFRDRVKRPEKQWKLSGMDLESRRRWYAYSRARDRMLEATDKEISPWNIVKSDDKRLAHLNCISHILENIPYEPLSSEMVSLPEPDDSDAYDDHKSLKGRRFIPEKF